MKKTSTLHSFLIFPDWKLYISQFCDNQIVLISCGLAYTIFFASRITIIKLRSSPIPPEQTNPSKIGRQSDPNQGIWLLKLDHQRRGASLSSIGHVFKLIQWDDMVVVLKGKDFITTRFDQLKSRLIRVDLIVENIAHLTCHLCIICQKLVKYFHILKLQSIIAFCWRQGGPNLTPIQLNQMGPWSLKWDGFLLKSSAISLGNVLCFTHISLATKTQLTDML